ncbi:nucleotidyltransferase [Terrihabitans rhizophilus]|jgi:hypothetical protein|uniref:Nucleotidyltransferase n=1 Tax=Terrihabitans rhizophilus TaxID=3092662 RepID=A0ABU4RQE3_9HYPH|nr:nucleotidyltransferase [Terrihabitans sp. PJ23]MDX6807059.1 nucleotidyltransferase [Terrihabitans sp. PJ23]
MTSSHVEPSSMPVPPRSEAFYAESLVHLKQLGVPFLVSGTYAVSSYTGIRRPTKDLDVFCRAGDYPRILRYFQELGHKTVVEDERWIAKVKKGRETFDVIFNSRTAATPITDSWFAEKHTSKIYGTEVQLVAPTELVYSKVFVQNRERYDGADIAHVILKQHAAIDWRRLLGYMEQYWEVLFIHLLNFRFVYPTQRHCVPDWLFDELLERLQNQRAIPESKTPVCRGRLFSPPDYLIDITEWGFADLVG